ncbi:calvin cycle protein CP12-3, chloroplastic [Bidens hawaiensis]|uniref:calvin cycle protein CP12-3, chloroplastic n=1 Tax=Bidens hawaiensis TaxID=980011 RepID=UPI00404A6CC2
MQTTTVPFKLPPSFRSTTTTPIRTSIPVLNAVTGGGSAKYKGTQMREKKLTELIEAKVAEAKQVCEADRESDECKVAWDEVEEVSQAKADLRRKLDENKDPLQSFCEENPETDECRIFED